MLTGILAHADNTVLLVPTVQVVCKMLLICEEYVAAFCEPLNAKKIQVCDMYLFLQTFFLLYSINGCF